MQLIRHVRNISRVDKDIFISLSFQIIKAAAQVKHNSAQDKTVECSFIVVCIL